MPPQILLIPDTGNPNNPPAGQPQMLIPSVGTPAAGQPQVLMIPDNDPSVGQPQVLIPVTGDDLSEKENERQVLVSRIHQFQTGLNFLGFGLILMGITLMAGKKKEEDLQKED